MHRANKTNEKLFQKVDYILCLLLISSTAATSEPPVTSHNTVNLVHSRSAVLGEVVEHQCIFTFEKYVNQSWDWLRVLAY